MNRESKNRIGRNPKGDENKIDEVQQNEIIVNRAPVIPLTLNPKDYESNSDEGHDEEFPESKVSLHPNPKDYEDTIDEEGDEECEDDHGGEGEASCSIAACCTAISAATLALFSTRDTFASRDDPAAVYGEYRNEIRYDYNY